MGLDMYLSKKTYVKQWSHQSKKDKFSVSVKKGNKKYEGIRPERVSYITEEIMYWRKANQIHGWFVENCREIEEEVTYRVTMENLKTLLETCKKVLEILNKAEKKTIQVVGGWSNGEDLMVDTDVYEGVDEVMELLPPTQGFFFGSDNIDDWYKEAIEETIEALESELSISNGGEYEYEASW